MLWFMQGGALAALMLIAVSACGFLPHASDASAKHPHFLATVSNDGPLFAPSLPVYQPANDRAGISASTRRQRKRISTPSMTNARDVAAAAAQLSRRSALVAAAGAVAMPALAVAPASPSAILKTRTTYGPRLFKLQQATAAEILADKNLFTLFITGVYSDGGSKATKLELERLSTAALLRAKEGDAETAQAFVRDFVKLAQITESGAPAAGAAAPSPPTSPAAPAAATPDFVNSLKSPNEFVTFLLDKLKTNDKSDTGLNTFLSAASPANPAKADPEKFKAAIKESAFSVLLGKYEDMKMAKAEERILENGNYGATVSVRLDNTVRQFSALGVEPKFLFAAEEPSIAGSKVSESAEAGDLDSKLFCIMDFQLQKDPTTKSWMVDTVYFVSYGQMGKPGPALPSGKEG